MRKLVICMVLFCLIASNIPITSIAATNTTGVVTATSLNVRYEPTTKSKIIGSLKKGSKVNVLSQKKDWIEIPFGKGKAWVSSSYISINKTTVQVQKEYVTASTLNVRKNATTTSSVLFTLQKGQAVTILSKKTGWKQVKAENGKVGWVSDKYLSTQKPTANAPAPVKTNQVVITANNVNIRSGPGTKYSVIQTVNIGTAFESIGTQGDWTKIKLQSKKEGWVASWLIKKKDANVKPPAPPTPSIPISTSNLKGKRIVIDAGHGGYDSGTVGKTYGSLERDLTLSTSILLAKKLQQAGAFVTLTRSDNTYLSLSSRVNKSHQAFADSFVSVHFNSASSSARGIMSFYYTANKEKKLAESIQGELLKQTSMVNQNVRFGDYHVIRENKQPAVLLELGFLSNSVEELLVSSKGYQEKAANGIVSGLSRYFTNL
jgi:N-acetylmuramoyl-L-alanine amidase